MLFALLSTSFFLGSSLQVEDLLTSVSSPFTEIEYQPNFDPLDENFSEYIPVLMFHYIENIPSNASDQIRYRLSFSPEKLEKFLIFFQENNVTPLTFWDLKKITEGKKKMPEKAVILTFDDGHIDHYTEAFRLLEQYNMKGVFFIISAKPDNDNSYATWDNIKEISDSGHEIGSHSVTHRNLATLGYSQLQEELELSKITIENKIQKPVISFCYPSGKYNHLVLDVIKNHYLFARTTESGEVFSMINRYKIKTVRIFPTTSITSLRVWFDQ